MVFNKFEIRKTKLETISNDKNSDALNNTYFLLKFLSDCFCYLVL